MMAHTQAWIGYVGPTFGVGHMGGGHELFQLSSFPNGVCHFGENKLIVTTRRPALKEGHHPLKVICVWPGVAARNSEQECRPMRFFSCTRISPGSGLHLAW